jgi:hypothetical protein
MQEVRLQLCFQHKDGATAVRFLYRLLYMDLTLTSLGKEEIRSRLEGLGQMSINLKNAFMSLQKRNGELTRIPGHVMDTGLNSALMGLEQSLNAALEETFNIDELVRKYSIFSKLSDVVENRITRRTYMGWVNLFSYYYTGIKNQVSDAFSSALAIEEHKLRTHANTAEQLVAMELAKRAVGLDGGRRGEGGTGASAAPATTGPSIPSRTNARRNRLNWLTAAAEAQSELTWLGAEDAAASAPATADLQNPLLRMDTPELENLVGQLPPEQIDKFYRVAAAAQAASAAAAAAPVAPVAASEAPVAPAARGRTRTTRRFRRRTKQIAASSAAQAAAAEVAAAAEAQAEVAAARPLSRNSYTGRNNNASNSKMAEE